MYNKGITKKKGIKKGIKKMSKTKTKFSTCKVLNKKGVLIGYLSMRDEENGLDAILDMKGYAIIAL